MSLQDLLDQEKFKSSYPRTTKQLFTASRPKVSPIDYEGGKYLFERANLDLIYRLRICHTGVLETLLLVDWTDGYDEYDPFAEEDEPRTIGGYKWKYYGWAEVRGRTVCGNGAILIPKTFLQEPSREGNYTSIYRKEDELRFIERR
jgi:hypothetical protein